jgi:hypothetical protein
MNGASAEVKAAAVPTPARTGAGGSDAIEASWEVAVSTTSSASGDVIGRKVVLWCGGTGGDWVQARGRTLGDMTDHFARVVDPVERGSYAGTVLPCVIHGM